MCIYTKSSNDFEKLGNMADIRSMTSFLNLVSEFHTLNTEMERQSLNNSSHVVCALYFLRISNQFQSVFTVLQSVHKGKESRAIPWFKRGSLC